MEWSLGRVEETFRHQDQTREDSVTCGVGGVVWSFSEHIADLWQAPGGQAEARVVDSNTSKMDNKFSAARRASSVHRIESET
jgi:hypothetical protein